MEILNQYWDILLLGGAIIFHAARSYSAISELQKDVRDMHSKQNDLIKWTQTQEKEITRGSVQIDTQKNNISELWTRYNELRNRINGKSH